ncbi:MULTISPECIES: NlpC/P60 family protein [unclassified Streptomyces]|uniref:C40 family peptidase n=1 Tax=unclassified Streptomyces TaxID=2593676 RepID=UPI003369E934
MASHRKPKQRSLTGGTAWTAAIALAGAAATVIGGTGHAETRPTPAQVRAKVDQYQREAEEANEKYNGAKEKADKARQALDRLRDEAARGTARLNASRNALGAFATAQYRSGTVAPTLQLALSSSPEQFLRRASLANRASSRQAATVAGLSRQSRTLRRLRGEAQDQLDRLRGAQAALARHRGVARKKLAAARALLDRLTDEQRRRYAAREAAQEAREARKAREALEAQNARPGAASYAASGRAARAVSYAYGALGKPYVWGATGPHGYDCSGLTQAAWQAAGVALPRTTYTQINAGRRVSRTQLAPGDLVFFYSGVSHVGLYIGGGLMIHAPRPGAPVRVAPIDQMPFAGATRPA